MASIDTDYRKCTH